MKKICICSSVTFYKEVVSLSRDLENRGYEVVIPSLARTMQESGDYNFLSYQERFNSEDPSKKGQLIQAGFKNIEESDAIIVANYEKMVIKDI